MPEVDPIASMRIWAVEVDVAPGSVARVPPLPATDWLPCVMRMDVMGVLDLVEDVDLDELVLSGVVSNDDIVRSAVKLLEAAAGRTAWSALALGSLAHRYWASVGGDLVRMSVRFDQISLSAALDAFYGSLTRSMDDKEIKRLNSTLDRPAPEFQIALKQESTSPRDQRPPARPLPATAERYVRVRPKTQLRRPQDRPSGRIEPPTGRPEERADSGRVATSDSRPVDVGSHLEVSPGSGR